MAFNSKSINFKAGLDTKGVATGVQQIQGHMSKMSRDVNNIKRSFSGLHSAIVGAFALDRIGSFATEAFNLAAKAEGVKRAFNALNDPNLLENLRKATKGTVDDLTLMQTAVKARNFKIPLEQLSTYFRFAQQRARETGESVDYLVESIITGLGRQSVMILDNLGISSAEIKKQMEGGASMAEALGKIIQSEMPTSALEASNVADQVDKIKSAFVNLKIYIGEQVIPIVSKFAEKIENYLKYGGEGIQIFGMGLSRADIKTAEAAAKEKEKQLRADLKTKDLAEQYATIQQAIEDTEQNIANTHKSDVRLKATRMASIEGKAYLYILQQINKEFEKSYQVTGGGGGVITPSITEPDPLSLQEQISIAKKSNKAISELESQGLSKAQVKALDTAFAINVMNDNLSQIPETLATIDSGLTGKPPLSEFQKGIEEMTENVRSMLEGLVTTIAVDFFGAIGEAMVMGGDSFKSFGQQTLEAMGRFFKQIGAMFISYGIAALEFFKTLLVPANAPALIAAGIALSLIGGAISGAAKSMAQTGQPSGAGVPAQSGGMGYNFETRIDGYDLVLVNDRNQRLRNRRG